ncbi:hypothetical protein P8452_12535 [Trifolium repens]|nr:hypothetical protein P8452_12535 [Trifolium repens]
MATQPESSQNLPKIHSSLAGKLKMVHDEVKPVIWRLQMTWGRKYHQNATPTAFAVKPNLLMTCAHGGWTTHNNLEIIAKPLSRSNQTYRAYVVDEKVDCDMVLLRVEGIANMEIGKYGGREVMNPKRRHH